MMAGFGLVWILVLAVVVFAIVAIVRKAGGAGLEPPTSRGDGAVEILRQRYARGDIDRDDFEERLHELQH